MVLIRTILLLAACGLFFTCTPDQRNTGRAAEQAYVDLFYAVHTADAATAKTSARALDKVLVRLRTTWQRPFAEARLDDLQYHLDQAAWVYADARASIEAEDFELAAIQLDRATYELAAASPAAFRELYIGSIYDFLITWLEVEHTIGEPDLCAMEWPAFSQYAKDVKITWRRVRKIRPEPQMYAQYSPIDPDAFWRAHERMDEALEDFQKVLLTADQCLAAAEAQRVSQAVWDLVLLFGSTATDTAL